MRTAIISREELVRRIQGLPPLPQTMMRVWQVIDNPTSNARTLAGAICADPSLVASLLKLANSASYGRSRTIQAIPEAITLMGFNVIKKMGRMAKAQHSREVRAGLGVHNIDMTNWMFTESLHLYDFSLRLLNLLRRRGNSYIES